MNTINPLFVRQNPLPEDHEGKMLAKMIGIVEGRYGSDEDLEHPISRLLKRKDGLSSTELFWLGRAIERMETIDCRWTEDQIAKTKEEDANNRKGAFFELLALDMLNTRGTNVTPMPRNYPGVDARIALPCNRFGHVSLKKYGLSTHFRDFASGTGQTKGILVDALKTLKRNVQAFVWARTYPTSRDWQVLQSQLPSLLKQSSRYNEIVEIENQWNILLKPMKGFPGDTFSSSHISWTLTVASSAHQNDHQNLNSQFDEAASKIRKFVQKCPNEPKDFILLFCGLPITADPTLCTKWARDYFQDRPDSPMDAVLFYQPFVVSGKDGSNFLAHYMFCLKSRQGTQTLNGVQIPFEVPLGVPVQQKPPLVLCNERGEQMLVPQDYVIQEGEEFLVIKQTSEGAYEGHFGSFAPGINQNLVVEVPGLNPVVLSGYFSATPEIL